MFPKKYSGGEAKTAAASSIDCIYHCTYLPEEVVFRFLLLVPAQLLHDVARHVCREWSLVISSRDFAHRHYRNSIDGGGGGLLIQPLNCPRKGFYLEMRGGRLEMSKFDCGFMGFAGGSCNGLVLISHPTDSDPWDRCTYVANPLTKQRMALPPLSPKKDSHYEDSAIAFLEASTVFKVTRACGDNCVNPKTRIQVLTIGVDRVWRDIDIRHLLLSSYEGFYFNFPLVTGGCYVHWPSVGFVLTLNLETETVARFSSPAPGFRGRYLAMGGNLSFVQRDSGGERWWGVWEMNSVTGEWTVLCRIDDGPINDRFKGDEIGVIPVCWLAAREVLVFAPICRQKGVIAYNVKTGEIQSFEWEIPTGFLPVSCHLQPHVNSLVWLGG